MNKKTKKRKLFKAKTALPIFIITAVCIWLIIKNVYNKNCGKWLFLTETRLKVDNADRAIEIFKQVLVTEDRYKKFDFPSDREELLNKFNIIPYKREETVLEKDGSVMKKEVYDMLLAYLIDEEGNVYKYNMCRII